MPDLRVLAVIGGYLLGGLAVLGGIGHAVAVTIEAFEEGRGYDIRLGDMLAIGLLPLILGAAMVFGAWQTHHDAPRGLALLAISSALFAVVLLVLWRVIFTGPDGSLVGGVLTVVAYTALAVIAWLAR